ncbi:ester cyclase [Burkholderia glumae]
MESRRKRIVREFYEQVWDRQVIQLLPSMFHSEFTFRSSLNCTLVGYEEFSRYVQWLTSTLGDYVTEIREVIEEGAQVCAKLRFEGEHRKVFFGHAPSNQRVWWDGVAIFTFDEDLVRDLWVLGDVYGLTRRMGGLSDAIEFTRSRGRSDNA